MEPKKAQSTLHAHLRKLPQVSAVLEQSDMSSLIETEGLHGVTRSIRALIEESRQRILRGHHEASPENLCHITAEAVRAHLKQGQKPLPTPVLNGTGVIIHTNLGRAPLSSRALEALCAAGEGYSALEYDIEAGSRGSRHHLAKDIIQDLTKAEDAAVVNNCAAAVLLSLSALAHQKEVIISRGELVEIGGGFRVPDVMKQSGCKLVEVGTTNRTRPSDYESAITEDTAMLMSVHRSNFALIGFTEDADLNELAKIAKAHEVPLMVDAGSGYLKLMNGCDGETTVSTLIEMGVDLITFSGDKLLGGPQAGIIIGRTDLVQKIRKHPLMRALRPCKLTLAALITTLTQWRDAPEAIPVVRMIEASTDSLTKRSRSVIDTLRSHFPDVQMSVQDTVAQIGGGTSPLATIQSQAICISVPHLNRFTSQLRQQTPPLIGRIDHESVLIDLRTIPEEHDHLVCSILKAALSEHLS